MAIKKPISITFNLDSHNSVQSVCAVIHIDDKNTETLDLSLMQGGEHIAVSPNSTVTARFVRVKNNTLISDDVACTVQENGNIYIPIDNAAAQHMLVGEIKIEVNIVDENDILTMQFPLVIRVNNTILADAEISPESEGTIPELLEEAREAAEDAAQAAEAATEAISTKQDKLTAGENITITEENVISASSGSNDYTELENKPSINNVTLSGNKTSDDLSLQGKLTAGQNITIEGNVISAEGGVTDYDDLTDKPRINGYVLSGNKSSDDLGLMSINTITGVPRNDIYVNYHYDFNKNVYLERDIYINEDSYNNRYRVGVQDNFFRDYSGTMGVIKHGEYDFDSIEKNYAFCGCLLFSKSELRHAPSFINQFRDTNIRIIQLFTPKSGTGNISLMVRYIIGTDSTSLELRTFYQATTATLQQDGSYSITYQSNWQELTGGGAQIVSGVVNANGTITFTDSEGNSFTTSGESVIGTDGFSPVATVTQTASGATVSITDKNGTTTANITNGQDGNDYVLTTQDKDDIADIVLSELPTTQGVLYGNTSN